MQHFGAVYNTLDFMRCRSFALSIWISASFPAAAQQAASEECLYKLEAPISFELRAGTSDASEVRRFKESLPLENWSQLIPDRYGRHWLVRKEALISSNDIDDITVEPNAQAFLGEATHLLRVLLTKDGADKLLRVTEVRRAKELVFLLNGVFAGAVVVRAPIPGGSFQFLLSKCSEEQLTTIASRIMKSNPAVQGTLRDTAAQRP